MNTEHAMHRMRLFLGRLTAVGLVVVAVPLGAAIVRGSSAVEAATTRSATLEHHDRGERHHHDRDHGDRHHDDGDHDCGWWLDDWWSGGWRDHDHH
jgi:hypothetical protein